MDRLTEEAHDGEAVGYSYDLCGNRIKKVDKNGSEVYTYNVKNQLASRKSEKSETCYRYDQQGNVLEATGTEGGTYYTYNAFNQQTKVRKSDGSCLESRYDAEYLRAGTVENGKVSSFVYYNDELISELDQEQETARRYILGYGVAAGWNHKSEGYHFYHLDEQNSTAYITGMEGGIENRYQYDAFGVITDRQEGFDNRILYTGQQYDPITEQYYLRARYYNPTVGRFLQEDVYRGDGLNLYAYCENNPVIYYDPSGFDAIPVNKPGYFVYGLYDEGSDIPYYIGITNDPDRRRQQHIDSGRLNVESTKDYPVVGDLRYIERNVTYGEARGYEQFYIEKYDTRKGVRGIGVSQDNRQNINNSYNKDRTDDRARYFNETYNRMKDEEKKNANNQEDTHGGENTCKE